MVSIAAAVFLEGVEAGGAGMLLGTTDMTWIDGGQVRECVGRGKKFRKNI
jgi:hypothetical protein